MIQRINYKKLIDIYDFVLTCKDRYEDFYITKENKRLFLTDIKIAEKTIKYNEIYALYNKGIQGLLMITRDKGFRPYLKILAVDSKIEWNLLRFFSWNFYDEIYAKLKISNPLVRTLQKQNRTTMKLIFGFINKGNRGAEVLLFRPKQERRIIKGEEKNDSEYST
jgi:hypothetical protein